VSQPLKYGDVPPEVVKAAEAFNNPYHYQNNVNRLKGYSPQGDVRFMTLLTLSLHK